MGYPGAAWERAMTVQEVVLKALSGEIHWFRAADILGMSARTLRRWRERYEQHGYVGLVDKRRHTPSVRRIAAPVVERLLRLYRERYRGFNVRHFHQIARREHGVSVSYSFLKQALQAAGLVKKHRARGRHRCRREPRACGGELLHLDGSPDAWLALVPELRLTLIAVVDDATKRLLYAQLEVAEKYADGDAGPLARRIVMVVERGQIWWADLGGPDGPEPGIRRPVLIVQDDAFNRSRLRTVIVVVLTTNVRLLDAPGNVLLPAKATGLPKDSVANVSQVVTVDRDFLLELAGRLPGQVLREVEHGLRLVLGL